MQNDEVNGKGKPMFFTQVCIGDAWMVEFGSFNSAIIFMAIEADCAAYWEKTNYTVAEFWRTR